MARSHELFLTRIESNPYTVERALDTGQRVAAGADAPDTARHGLYIWSRSFTIKGKSAEADGKRYIPHFTDSSKTCTAYANINPYKAGQQVRREERMWAVHDNSTHIRIRYIATKLSSSWLSRRSRRCSKMTSGPPGAAALS